MEESKNVTFYMITEDQISEMIERSFKKLIEREENKTLSRKVCSKSAAARELGVHRVTIYNMIADGRLKTTSDGKQIVVSSLIEYKSGKKNEEKCAVKVNKRGHKVYV